MATLSLRGLRKSFGGATIVDGLDLDILDREFVVFVGPSGCGKSTLLRMIAGLEPIDGGDLLIDGRRVNDVGPADRGLAMVFQSYALYPHMTVRQNMSFALRLAGAPKDERDRKVDAAARVLQLESLLDRKPGQLSGGQRQRVAIGRAIVRSPGVFLFDEPLSNLDASLRGQMRVELARLHAALDATMIYVTHDQVEAMTMADRIVVLRSGRIEQVGTPLDIYRHPANLFVASFLGSPRMNMLAARVAASGASGVAVAFSGGEVTVDAVPVGTSPGAPLTLGIRPEGLRPSATGGLEGIVALVEHLGALALIHVSLPDGETVIAQVDGAEAYGVHQPIRLSIDPRFCHLFGPDGRTLPSGSGAEPPAAASLAQDRSDER